MNSPARLSLLGWTACGFLLSGALLRLELDSLIAPALLLSALGLTGVWRGWLWAIDLAWLGTAGLGVGAAIWGGLHSGLAGLAFSLLLAALGCGLAGWNLGRLAAALQPLEAELVDPAVIRRQLLRLGALLAVGGVLALLSLELPLRVNLEAAALLALLCFAGVALLLRRR